MVYYNEFDPKAAAWLRVLIKEGHIAYGYVDERGIEDVKPADLIGYAQCHFFAGVGVWSYALRQAGWSDDTPVWTVSCPCQPFSAAGKSAGFADERHLWPAFYHLLTQGNPLVVFGEQVASKDGLAWLDLVQADLEGAGYTSGAADICAAGVGSPNIRQRLYFAAERLAYTDGNELQRGEWERPTGAQRASSGHLAECSLSGGLANPGLPESPRRDGIAENRDRSGKEGEQPGHESTPHGGSNGLADPDGNGRDEKRQRVPEAGGDGSTGNSGATEGQPGPTNGLWRAADWLFCRDEKWRPVEPGTFPLVNGAAARVGRLRGYGNALNAEVARAFIESFMESRL